MEKRIYVGNKGQKHLEQVFNCTHVMVWKALTFNSDSELARKIRHVALTQLGGVPSWTPEAMETIHEEAAGTMTQRYGERVQLVVKKTDGSVNVMVDGSVTRSERDMSISEFMRLQRDVEKMAMSL